MRHSASMGQGLGEVLEVIRFKKLLWQKSYISYVKMPLNLPVSLVIYSYYQQDTNTRNAYVNSSSSGQNGRCFVDDIFRCIFVNENCCILIRIAPNFVSNGPIDSKPALVQVMAWCRTGDKPSSEPMFNHFINAYMRH